ncbi:MAG: metallophosphoesterase [Sandaracinaceae bacterium]
MHAFPIFVLVGTASVAVLGGIVRSRFFAIFLGILLSLQGLCAMAIREHFTHYAPLVTDVAFFYLQGCLYVHFASLVRARMRPLWFRALVSYPGLTFGAASLLAFPFAIVAALGVEPWGVEICVVAALLGLGQSLYTRETDVHLSLDGEEVASLSRRKHGRGRVDRPLRIVQITDPHLGPFMTTARLRRICERAVSREPDLILLTGDFLTMESHSDPRVLEDALAPLAAYEGKTFACFGNHDHEAPELVRAALSKHGITLLVDEEAVVDTPAGPVQLIGSDFHFRERAARLAALCERYPRRDGHLRIVLLHDPGAFKHVPEDHGDLVLSGHTHGGQVGFLTLGVPSTAVSLFTSIPDHGFWARGRDRLYVHRGTGVYGFPLRVGVPGEQSLLHVHDAREALAAE